MLVFLSVCEGELPFLGSIAITWRYRNTDFIQGIVHPKTSKPLAIEFDNGTVRHYKAPDDRSSAKVAAKPVGTLRKCTKGSRLQTVALPDV